VNVDAAREALLVDARDDADRLLAEAEAEATAAAEDAQRQASEIIDRAREQGRSEGHLMAAREEAQARMLARMEVFAAQRQAYDELRSRARGAVLALRDGPGYTQLLDRLAAAARRDLGEEADIELDPENAGGVRARAGSRAVDYTLVALADRCVQALGPAARQLWE
jgi:vacuolar-type H+-ATPase subunit E/Vma4